MTEYIIGVSLGAANQWTTACIMERVLKGDTWEYHLLKAERFSLGLSYPKTAEKLQEYITKLQEGAPGAECAIAADITGVGVAVLELFDRYELAIDSHVNITTAAAETWERGVAGVPKKNLVSVLKVFMDETRLQIAKGMPALEAMAKEMDEYGKEKPAPTTTADPWRDKPHDDYVFALGVALWHGEQNPPGSGAGGPQSRPGFRITTAQMPRRRNNERRFY